MSHRRTDVQARFVAVTLVAWAALWTLMPSRIAALQPHCVKMAATRKLSSWWFPVWTLVSGSCFKASRYTQGSLVQPCQAGLNSNRGWIPSRCLTLLCRRPHPRPLNGGTALGLSACIPAYRHPQRLVCAAIGSAPSMNQAQLACMLVCQDKHKQRKGNTVNGGAKLT